MYIKQVHFQGQESNTGSLLIFLLQGVISYFPHHVTNIEIKRLCCHSHIIVLLIPYVLAFSCSKPLLLYWPLHFTFLFAIQSDHFLGTVSTLQSEVYIQI